MVGYQGPQRHSPVVECRGPSLRHRSPPRSIPPTPLPALCEDESAPADPCNRLHRFTSTQAPSRAPHMFGRRLLSTAAAVFGLAILLMQGATHHYGAMALPTCPELRLALSDGLAAKLMTAVAGKTFTLLARIRNRGTTTLDGVGVKITIPPDWVVRSSKASPTSRGARKTAIIQGRNAFWVDMVLAPGMKRKFLLRLRVPGCQAATAAVPIGMAAFRIDSGTGDSICLSEGTSTQVEA